MSNESIDSNSNLNNNCPPHGSSARGGKAVSQRYLNK